MRYQRFSRTNERPPFAADERVNPLDLLVPDSVSRSRRRPSSRCAKPAYSAPTIASRRSHEISNARIAMFASLCCSHWHHIRESVIILLEKTKVELNNDFALARIPRCELWLPNADPCGSLPRPSPVFKHARRRVCRGRHADIVDPIQGLSSLLSGDWATVGLAAYLRLLRMSQILAPKMADHVPLAFCAGRHRPGSGKRESVT